MAEKTQDHETEAPEPQAEAEDQPKRPAKAPVDDVVPEEICDLPRVETATEAKAILEALLFTTNQSLSTRKLTSLLPGWTERQVLDMLIELRDECDDSGRGVMIQEVAGGWIMATRPRWADFVFSLHRSKRRNPLTPQALETLAIVAYKQPITRSDIEVIRGVDSGGMLRNLLDLNLVEVVGHRETIGRPPLYGTTKLFLRTFGLKTLGDLPSVEELMRLLPPPGRTVEAPSESQPELPLSERSEAPVSEPAEVEQEEELLDEEVFEDGEDEEEFEDDDDEDFEEDEDGEDDERG